MKNLTYNYIDKSEWGAGAWNNEPDKEQWVDKTTGLACLAVRHPSGGFWCGYVGIDETHPLFGKEYEAPDVEVHGGLTFADSCQEREDEHGICHIPEAGEPDNVWWFGFDCAHGGDVCPAYAYRYADTIKVMTNYESYRDLEYVKSECANPARQLIGQTNGTN